ncbi:MAG: low affinity iron permease family protein [Candidatus Saccharimonas sp.]
MKNRFRIVAGHISTLAGSAYVFILAIVVIAVWAVSGPLFKFSDTWQLIINTGTTIVTFLMVFLIQNTQNRDSKALQLKLDELIRSTKGARLHYISLENLSDEELEELDREFKVVANNPNSRRSIQKLQTQIQEANSRRQKFGAALFSRKTADEVPLIDKPAPAGAPKTPPSSNL